MWKLTHIDRTYQWNQDNLTRFVCLLAWFNFSVLSIYKTQIALIFFKLKKQTILGEPDEIIHLGRTEILEDEFVKYLNNLSQTRFKYTYLIWIIDNLMKYL